MAESSNARHRLRRPVLAALVPAVLAATLFAIPSSAGATAPPASSGTGSAAVPRLAWASCGEEPELQAFQCATAVVPLDSTSPRAGRSPGSYLARPTPTCSPARSGPWSWTASSTRSPGPPAAGGQAKRLPFSTRLRSAKGAYETLQEFLRLCDAGGPNCAFSEGNPQRRFDRLARRLLREPVEFNDPASGEVILVTYAELIGTTLGVLYDPVVWPEWAVVLQQLWELTSPEAAAASLRAVQARLGTTFQQEDYPNFVDGFPGVACSETHNRTTSAPGPERPGPRTAGTPTSAGPGPGSPASASPTWCRSPSRRRPRPSRRAVPPPRPS